MNKTKGFTIIELIVVIAIIAVLAAIVAVNVVSYIAKSKDAAVKSNLDSAQIAMAVLVDTTGITDTSCAAGNLKNAYDAAAALSGAESCADSATSGICACAQMVSDTAKYMCVDSAGNKRVDSAITCAVDCVEGADYVCDGT